MHDIICPDCGERFMGYDVAFDMSEHILSLLCGTAAEQAEARSAGFRFYADEETIRRSNPRDDVSSLRCRSQIGPGAGDRVFTFTVNGKTMFEYLAARAGEDRLDLIKSISQSVSKNDYSAITPAQLSEFSSVYHTLFKASEKLVGDISIEEKKVRTALRIVSCLYENRDDTSAGHTLSFPVAIYSEGLRTSDRGTRYVPDVLFVNTNGRYEQLRKCCRFCGKPLPREFGYYRMKPVVLLGSHSSGKTSYLLALLHAVQTKPPFITEKGLSVAPLNNDDNYEAFRKNIDRFRRGSGPDKTDFVDVPILNLLANGTIYSFIDWPGEKFSDGERADLDYVLRSKRVISKARHVFFFLPPEQIDGTLPSTEEKVVIDVSDLAASLKLHLGFPDPDRMTDLVCILNKVDKLEGQPNTADMFAQINGKDDDDVYSGSWKGDMFECIEGSSESYVASRNPMLYSAIDKVTSGGAGMDRYYVPAAPYGYDAPPERSKDAPSEVLHRGYMAGIPFLFILKRDGAIR